VGASRRCWAVVALALGAGYWIREVPEVPVVRSAILAPEGKSFNVVRDRSGGLGVSPTAAT